MTEDDFSTIEKELNLRLPDLYRRVLQEHRVKLKQVEWFEDDGALYLGRRSPDRNQPR